MEFTLSEILGALFVLVGGYHFYAGKIVWNISFTIGGPTSSGLNLTPDFEKELASSSGVIIAPWVRPVSICVFVFGLLCIYFQVGPVVSFS